MNTQTCILTITMIAIAVITIISTLITSIG